MLKKFDRPFILKPKFLVIIFFTLLAVTLVEIWSMNRLASYGTQISDLENSKTVLTLENQDLEKQIAEKMSLKYTEAVSKNLGFQRVKNYQYVKDHDLALNQ